jgi:hypothetical protein
MQMVRLVIVCPAGIAGLWAGIIWRDPGLLDRIAMMSIASVFALACLSWGWWVEFPLIYGGIALAAGAGLVMSRARRSKPASPLPN